MQRQNEKGDGGNKQEINWDKLKVKVFDNLPGEIFEVVNINHERLP